MSESYPSPEANAWGSGTEYAPSGDGGLTDASGIIAALEGIRQELSAMRVDSAAMRELSQELIEEARRQDEQPPTPVLPEPVPDFYPFAQLPAGTITRELPSGGRLFILPDGLILRTGCENDIVAIGENGEVLTVAMGPNGAVTVAPGRSLQLTPDFLRLTHAAAGIAGLPLGVEPVRSAPGRVLAALPGGTRLDVHQTSRLAVIVNGGGSVCLVGESRIEGIGEPAEVRLLAAGLKSFTFPESGHAGVVEPDGTIRLCLASGEDLTITFPLEDSGENPPPTGAALCPACGITHPPSGGAR